MTTKNLLTSILIVVVSAVWVTQSKPLQGRADEPQSLVQWDDAAAEELSHALHHMHELVNEGNFDEAATMVAGDDVLVTFELGTKDNATPVALRSKHELFAFMKQLFDGAKSDDGVTIILDKPKHRARATKTFGVVTEECTVRFRRANGEERVDKLFGTNLAVKYPDGWKFIQWHMSVAEPFKVYKDGKLVTTSASKGS